VIHPSFTGSPPSQRVPSVNALRICARAPVSASTGSSPSISARPRARPMRASRDSGEPGGSSSATLSWAVQRRRNRNRGRARAGALRPRAHPCRPPRRRGFLVPRSLRCLPCVCVVALLVRFSSSTEFAALPLLALWLAAIGFVTTPLGNMLSRHHERQADAYAVRMTGRPDAFASALRKLGRMNLADPSPHPLIEFLFSSHPSLARRLRAVEGS